MTIRNFAISLAKKAGKLINQYSGKNFKIEEKYKNNFVTEVDKAVENLIIKEIKKVFPDHKILGEETSFVKGFDPKEFENVEYIWIIDPIDGTNNFIRNIPYFAVSIALFKTKSQKKSKNFEYLQGELVLGVLFAPKLNKLYYAEKEKGAFLNGKRIHVSKTPSLFRSVLATGFHGKYKLVNLPYFEQILKNGQGFRRMGSAALDLAHTAEGLIDGYWEFGLEAWDIAAGALLVKEAGGQITDTNGNLLDLFGHDILASNKKIHKEIVNAFKKIN